MRKILVYSHEKDPITKTLLESVPDIYPISIRKFIDNCTIFDELSVKGAKIEWTFSDGVVVKNDENHFLINRVLGLSEDMFQDFAESDRKYSLNEYRAYLTFALASFPFANTRPGAFGLCGNSYSLPRQWNIINQSEIGLSIPQFYLGNLTRYYRLPGLVCSNPFKYYFWRPEIKDTSFGFIRPKGEPILITNIGNKILVSPVFNGKNLSYSILSRLEVLSRKLSDLFFNKIFEALVFLNDSELVFGMISNVPAASSKKVGFSGVVLKYFMDYVNECQS